MEDQYRRSPLVWVGSVVIALVVVGGLALGAYHLYAWGWARGAAAVGGTELAGVSEMAPPLPPVAHSLGVMRFPALGFFLLLILIGAVLRPFAWRRHHAQVWRHHWHGPWACHPAYQGDAGGVSGDSQAAAPSDEERRAA
jgi:hypothetical protein